MAFLIAVPASEELFLLCGQGASLGILGPPESSPTFVMAGHLASLGGVDHAELVVILGFELDSANVGVLLLKGGHDRDWLLAGPSSFGNLGSFLHYSQIIIGVLGNLQV